MKGEAIFVTEAPTVWKEDGIACLGIVSGDDARTYCMQIADMRVLQRRLKRLLDQWANERGS